MSDGKPEKKGGKLKLIIIAVVVLILGGGGAFFFLKPAPAEAEEVEIVEETIEGQVVDVGVMTVNLSDPDSIRYARVGIGLLIPIEGDGVAIAGKVPIMRDAALSVFMSRSSAELLTEAGLQDIRDLLTEKAHAIYGSEAVLAVLITELTIQ